MGGGENIYCVIDEELKAVFWDAKKGPKLEEHMIRLDLKQLSNRLLQVPGLILSAWSFACSLRLYMGFLQVLRKQI